MRTLRLFFIFCLTCFAPSTVLYSASLLPQERRHSIAENSARIHQHLIAAIGRNNLNEIDRFLQLSVDLNIEDKGGITPLKTAIAAKSLQIVGLLLRSGAKATSATFKFARALRDAADPDGFEHISLERIIGRLHDSKFSQITSVPLRQIPQPRQTQQPHIGMRAEGFDTEIQSCIRNPQHSLSNAELLSADQQGYIREIRELVSGRKLASGNFSAVNFSTVSPLLLSGPPGTGKTYFAEGIAAEIKSMQTSEGDIFTYFHIKASALNAGFAGDGVSRIKALSGYCKDHRTNVVIFFDELDTLFNRDSTKDGSSTAKNMLQTTAELWQLLDDLKESPSILVMAATNHQDDIDAALVGRFNETLSFECISNPTVIRSLVEQYVEQKDGLDKDKLPSLLPFCWFLWRPFLRLYPLSHREIKRFARNAMSGLRKSDREQENAIQSQHWSTAKNRLMRRKMLGLTRYCTKENFSLLMSTISVGSALYQCYRSHQQSQISIKALELQEKGLRQNETLHSQSLAQGERHHNESLAQSKDHHDASYNQNNKHHNKSLEQGKEQHKASLDVQKYSLLYCITTGAASQMPLVAIAGVISWLWH